MLKKLYIQNYALIKELDLDLKTGFTAITGETGSGKSILLGALGIALGERADTTVLFDKDIKCIVEAEFDISNLALEPEFNEADIDHANSSIFRREISTSGRSRAFINDTPVSLHTLKSMSTKLIDIHSQHQTLLLRDEGFQLELLDIFSDHEEVLEEYQTVYTEFQSKVKQHKQLKEDIQKNGIDKDYLEFQLNELEEINLEVGEDERLKEELGLLENVEEIKSVLNQAIDQMQSERGILDQLNSLSQSIEKIASHTKGLEEISSRVESVRLELDDVHTSIESIESSVELDPERQIILAEKLDALQHIMNKHRVSDMTELILLKKDMESRLENADSALVNIRQLETDIEVLKQQMNALSVVLTENRKNAKKQFIDKVSSRFKNLSLPNAEVDINISQSADYHYFGIDEINILFNANKGGNLEGLHKVASGGELSRLMLILKQQLAQSKELPTLIFDEIDSGVSGETASQMAAVLRDLSKECQVIAITHLPQVAGRSNHHLKISKSDTETRSITDITWLDDDGRIVELAKMLSGTKISEASVANAKDLLKN
ncbi:MAG: DNA repair protein RecN [Flavobacteriales bacterium]|nr:DNA repair protein RecN [Flavobacteriales bacterium]NNK80658.1 DNA repair protein RecN [Flavobacteriales bacterium]